MTTRQSSVLCGTALLLMGLFQYLYRKGEPSTLLLISGAFILATAAFPRRPKNQKDLSKRGVGVRKA